MPIDTIGGVKEAVIPGLLWVFGGTATFLYWISQWKKFSVSIYFINMFIAFFIGYVVWQFIGPDIQFRDWLISIGWSASIPIMSLIEKKWATLIYKFIQK